MIVRSNLGAFGVAAMLFVGDGVVLNQGVISGLVAAWIVFTRLPRIFLSEKYRQLKKDLIRCQAFYLGAAFSVLVFNVANNQIARNRGVRLVAAIESFRAKNNSYPKSLDALVPGEIESVPVAKYCFGLNEFFYYAADNQEPIFFYVVMPPFGRSGYSFKRKEWFSFD
jgi:hypothetical protein